ncbi:trigger factor [Desulfitobacterium sp. LBE]|uniref:trigger factor n=1 Tax=Desulfitobacterium sp. LBE TaxID=884086 RepID=UPI00119AB8D1|nr:trigger factor [Desulfitobacterium sp. LBE]TWH56750.1 trigger factor [Desulfitobacterium sp. LBE]
MTKHLIGVLLCALMAINLAGCSSTVSNVKSGVVLSEYKGLSYAKSDTTVSDQEVQDEIDALIESQAIPVEDSERSSTPVASGDELWIDYIGYVDGAEFEGGNSNNEGASLTIGSGSFIEGFEEALIGKTVGSTTDINVTFPDPYTSNTELSGKVATFTVTIHYVVKYEIPEFTDAFVNEYTQGEYTTAAEYRQSIYDSLVTAKEDEAKIAYMNEVIETAINNSTFTLDETEVEEAYNEMVEYYTSLAGSYGTDLETYASSLAMTLDDLYAELKTTAEDTLKQELFFEALIAAEQLNITEDDYAEKIGEYLNYYGYVDDQAGFEAAYDKEAIKKSMLYEKAAESLVEWGVPVEA